MFRFLILSNLLYLAWGLNVKKFPLLMPNIRPDQDDMYICTPARIVPNRDFYIVGFEPYARMDTVHHMILFGCTIPGTKDPYWNCGEMSSYDSSSHLNKSIPCENSHILYAWARDAKRLTLPKDVGFQVGQSTEIHFLVLQIHYTKKFPDGTTDSSGLQILYTEEPQSKLAGVLLLASAGIIPPQDTTYMETACTINEGKIIHPFAYRTHTHSLGRVVSGYNVIRDHYGRDHWILLGKRNPMTPQMFYPVFDKRPVGPQQRFAARCTMDSYDKDRVTHVGPTNNDEMCNFYLMYYVDRGEPLKKKFCMKVGPPYYSWRSDGFNNIPNEEASTLYEDNILA